jgi:hypothetical protein
VTDSQHAGLNRDMPSISASNIIGYAALRLHITEIDHWSTEPKVGSSNLSGRVLL